MMEAIFTDTDGTVFEYSRRLTASPNQIASFHAAAIAARDAWRRHKRGAAAAGQEIVASFQTAGETASFGAIDPPASLS
jgi:hypothetical protein